MEAQSKSGSPKQEALDVVIAELERSLKVLISNLDSLKARVDTDDLTRLLRRGAFMGKLHNLLHQTAVQKGVVTVMMIDVDHFKQVNDSHGHQTGDVVLQKISELISTYLRPQDLAGRFGGEEIIVAVEANAVEAMDIAERIRKAVESHIMKSTEQEFRITLSMGVASTQEHGFEADVLIASADAALYEAKRSGRNCIVVRRPERSQVVA